jgi:flagellar basal-body rod modification protein FlgD
MAVDVTASPVTGAYEPRSAQPNAPSATAGKDLFSSETFLKVLAAQVKSQNPLEPMKDTEFIGQMAQFSSLEQITSLNASMKALNLTTQLSQGAALVGRQVSYVPEGGDVPITGTVERLRVEGNGTRVTLQIGGVSVPASRVVEVR